MKHEDHEATAYTSRQTYLQEIDRIELISGVHSLRVALKRANRSEAGKRMFFAWPNLERASRKLAKWLSHGYPSTDDPSLLAAALASAASAYDRAAGRDRGTTNAPMTAYLLALIENAREVVHFRAYGMDSDGQTLRWNPSESSLIEWARRRRFERVVFSRVEPSAAELEGARVMAMSRVLTLEDIVSLEVRARRQDAS